MDDKKKLEITNRITDILYEIGIPANLKGFHCLRFGILLAYKDFGHMQRVTSVLYPEIGKALNTTSSRVERAIRHAIEHTFDKASPDSATKYFGRVLNAKPTNSEFIMILADRLLREDGIIPCV